MHAARVARSTAARCCLRRSSSACQQRQPFEDSAARALPRTRGSEHPLRRRQLELNSVGATEGLHRSGFHEESDAWTAALSKPGPRHEAGDVGQEGGRASADAGTLEVPLAAPHAHCSYREQQEWAQVLDRAPRPRQAAASSTVCASATASATASAKASATASAVAATSDTGAAAAPSSTPPAQPNVPGPDHTAAGAHAPASPSPSPSPCPSPPPLSPPVHHPLLLVIECGSHSTRALIAERNGRELARLCFETQLSQGLIPGGELHPEAVQRCAAALEAVRAEVQRCSRRQAVQLEEGQLQEGRRCSSEQGRHEGDEDRGTKASGGGFVDWCGSEEEGGAGGRRQRQQGCDEGCGEMEVTAVGTMALRQCRDPGAVAAHVRRLFGARLRVISGEEEGKLAYLGACVGLRRGLASANGTSPGTSPSVPHKVQANHPDGPGQGPQPVVVVVDLGGMSTELTWTQGDGLQVVSLPLGCVALTREFFDIDADSSSGATARCMEHVKGVLSQAGGGLMALRAQGNAEPAYVKRRGDEQGGKEEVEQQAAVMGSAARVWLHGGDAAACRGRGEGATQVVLVGGTATTVAALLLQLPAYDSCAVNGSCLSAPQLLDLATYLAGGRSETEGAEGASGRERCASERGGDGRSCAAAAKADMLRRFSWLSHARVQTLAAGACSLAAILDWLGAGTAWVSEADLLDGVMAEMVGQQARSQERAFGGSVVGGQQLLH